MSGRYMGMLNYERKAASKQFAAMSDDGGDQEAAYCEHITAAVTCDPAELIVDTWLDGFTFSDVQQPRLASLRLQLLYLLRANASELERAENAARLEGMANFSEWLEGLR